MGLRSLATYRRAPLVGALLLATGVTVLPAAPDMAHADAGVEAEFVAAVNRERAAVGLEALTVAGDLTSVARAHSGVMADGTDLHHNPNLGSDVAGWKKVGENVGRGPSVGAIHDAFMASAGHRRNIVDADWSEIGIGVVVRDGRIWVTEVFRRPTGAPAGPEPDPEPEPLAPEAATGARVDPSADPAPQPTGGTDAGPPAAEPTSSAASRVGPTPRSVDGPRPTSMRGPGPGGFSELPSRLDRHTYTLARLDAADRSTTLEAVLG